MLPTSWDNTERVSGSEERVFVRETSIAGMNILVQCTLSTSLTTEIQCFGICHTMDCSICEG